MGHPGAISALDADAGLVLTPSRFDVSPSQHCVSGLLIGSSRTTIDDALPCLDSSPSWEAAGQGNARLRSPERCSHPRADPLARLAVAAARHPQATAPTSAPAGDRLSPPQPHSLDRARRALLPADLRTPLPWSQLTFLRQAGCRFNRVYPHGARRVFHRYSPSIAYDRPALR